jgi:hypothetical protein
MATTALDYRRLGCSLWDRNLDGQAATSITNKLELLIDKHGLVDVETVITPEVWTVQDVLPPLIYFDDGTSHHGDDGNKYR